MALFVRLPDDLRELVDVSTIDLGIGKCAGGDRRDLVKSMIEDRSAPLNYSGLVTDSMYRQEGALPDEDAESFLVTHMHQ